MKLETLITHINNLFDTKTSPVFNKESGVTINSCRDVKKIGYCVNLTMESIVKAHACGVDLLITHHDIWDDFEDMQTDCRAKLKSLEMSHYFNHLPLDDAPFGTNDGLVTALNLKDVIKILEWEGLYFGRVGDLDQPVDFDNLVLTLEKILDEPVRSWQFSDKKIKKIGLVCGNGKQIPCLKTALEHQCDVYITGEQDLYTLQYAQYHQLNLIITSHTFMELIGLRNMMNKLLERSEGFEVVEIRESRLEATSRFKHDIK